MQIISHRGMWETKEDRNTASSILNSFNQGFGIETDLRDFNEGLVVSHDIANKNSLKIEELFKIYSDNQKELLLALNIKADGLQNHIDYNIKKYEISNYFLFDMSIPEQYVYIKSGFKVFSRQSEFEKLPVFYEQSEGIWMDEFETEWITEEIIQFHIENGKKVCIVSPELHGREYESRWKDYRNMCKKLDVNKVILCTDNPIEARRFFNGEY